MLIRAMSGAAAAHVDDTPSRIVLAEVILSVIILVLGLDEDNCPCIVWISA